ncbi:MAG: hypothetical protein G01um101477_165 [Candidatus Doudnabacteria bacterium Gr01-1014_77]|uniref:DUF11 domain-containing protein n=1 Tax=Candidatus Doudnabacteria bacterium Gr01-1014_77 TaxID=2017133 RepID=A0A554JD15_9BACT|nr:MAG: hypothetical protein G01um101477_165 [Candidatus Doudnabacteria bacterium Gr01-1014_77]
MTKLISLLKSKYSVAVVVVLAVAVFGFTKVYKQAQADIACTGYNTNSPALNIWPLTWTGEACHDYALVDAKNLNGGRYALSQAEHDAGFSVNPGDRVRVSVYFHNGANQAPASDPNVNIARNVTAFSFYDKNSGTSHAVNGSLMSSNAGTASSYNHGGDVTVKSSVATTLSYVPQSTQMCVSQSYIQATRISVNTSPSNTCGTAFNGETMYLVNLPDGISSNTGVDLGDLPACFPYAGFVIYTLQVNGVAGPSQANLGLTKTVGLTGQNPSSKSVNAKTGDVVDFRIRVVNDGPGIANNINLKDVLPTGMTLISGTSRLNGVGRFDSVVTSSYGYNTGMNLASGSEMIFTFSATVNATYGTLQNIASAQGSNTNYVSDSASVVVSSVSNVVCTIDSFTADSLTVSPGSSTILRFSGSNVISGSMYISGGRFNGFSLTGLSSIDTGAISTNTTYTITANGTGGPCSRSLTITVSTTPPPTGTICTIDSFTADNLTVNSGSSTTLRWTTSNVGTNGLYLSGGRFNGQLVSNSGSIDTGALTNTATYTLFSSGNTGSCTRSITVTVSGTPGTPGVACVIDTLTVDSATVNSGSSTTIHWTTSNIGSNGLYLSGGGFNGQPVANNGSISTNPLFNTSTFTLFGTGTNGSCTRSITVSVSGSPGTSGVACTIDSFSADSYNGSYGNSTILRWNTSNTRNLYLSGGRFNGQLVSNSGSIDTGALYGSTTFSLFGESNNGSCSRSLSIGTSQNNPGYSYCTIDSFTADSTTVSYGSSTTLRWSASSSSNLSIYGGRFNGQSVSSFGTMDSGPITGPTTFTISGYSSGGNCSRNLTVNTSSGQVAGVSYGLNLSKSAFNNTKNIDATIVPAEKENYITYTLVTTNTGNTTVYSHVVTDDLSNVMQYADLDGTDQLQKGYSLYGNTISFPAQTIYANSSVTNTFKVRVKYNLPSGSNLSMVNTYGNTVTIRLTAPQVLGVGFVAPKTGAGATLAVVFAAFVTILFGIAKRKGIVDRLLKKMPKVRIE